MSVPLGNVGDGGCSVMRDTSVAAIRTAHAAPPRAPVRARAIGWAVFMGVAGACGPALPPAQGPEPAPVVTEVEADPLLLLAERTEGGIEVAEIDAGEMLARAAVLAEDGEFLEAAQAYDEVARRFAGTPTELEALYRKGVCLEWADDWTGALLAFQRRLAPGGEGPVAPADVPPLIHASLLAEQLELWDQAAAGYERLLSSETLEPGDRRAATVRLAAVRVALGDEAAARPMLERVIRESEDAAAAGEAVHPAPAAEAQYRLGLLEAAKLGEIALDGPDARAVRGQAEALADAFGVTFPHFAAALRGGSPFWAVAAGYGIGKLYMDVYDAFFAAPVPEQLGGEARDAYLALLRARTRILLANALGAWEENLVRAERAGVRGPAVDATAEGIARVEAILEERTGARTEVDDAAEAFLEAQGEGDPLAPVLERLGGGGGAPAGASGSANPLDTSPGQR